MLRIMRSIPTFLPPTSSHDFCPLPGQAAIKSLAPDLRDLSRISPLGCREKGPCCPSFFFPLPPLRKRRSITTPPSLHNFDRKSPRTLGSIHSLFVSTSSPRCSLSPSSPFLRSPVPSYLLPLFPFPFLFPPSPLPPPPLPFPSPTFTGFFLPFCPSY